MLLMSKKLIYCLKDQANYKLRKNHLTTEFRVNENQCQPKPSQISSKPTIKKNKHFFLIIFFQLSQSLNLHIIYFLRSKTVFKTSLVKWIKC